MHKFLFLELRDCQSYPFPLEGGRCQRRMGVSATVFFLMLLFPVLSHAKPDPKFCATASASEFLKLAKERCDQSQKSLDLRGKSQLALEGVFFAEKCLAKDANQVGCYYYRAVNRGLDIETKTVGIKKDLARMIADFEKVIVMNESYDEGGAHLALGQVYLKAPSLPVLGKDVRRDLAKAEIHSQKALQIAPKNPENLKLAGDIAFKKNEFAEAHGYFKNALRLAKSSKDEKLQGELEKWVKKSKRKM